MAELTGVLLAAGFGSRFGTPKLLAQIEDRPVIAYSVAALAPCEHIIAVVRADDDALQAVLDGLSIHWITNPEPNRGMGHSIACAVRATADSDGWCILPADMPRVTTATTARIMDALRAGATLAAPVHQGRRGHPVGFGACFREDLMQLDGDTGGRTIIDQYADELLAITTADGGVLRDIDTPDDLAAVWLV